MSVLSFENLSRFHLAGNATIKKLRDLWCGLFSFKLLLVSEDDEITEAYEDENIDIEVEEGAGSEVVQEKLQFKQLKQEVVGQDESTNINMRTDQARFISYVLPHSDVT